MKSQWEKFKHRTLTKIFLGYAVVAWVLIQVIEAVLPTFETPLWVAQTITFLLILGFPIAIIVGWASEKLPNMPTDSEDASVAKPVHMTSRRRLVWIGVASCTIVGLFGFYMMPFIFDQQAFDLSQSSSVQVRPSLERSIRNRIILGDTGSRVWGSRSDIDISPDGNYLVFSEFSPPNIILKLKDMTSFDQPKELTQFNMNQNNGYPTFSEDGQWIYYHLADSLRRIRIEGGTPQVAIDSGVAPSGVAVRNETIVYSDSNSRALLAFDLNTGLSQAIFENQEEGVSFQYTWPQFIPGIEKLVATRGARGSFDNSSIDVINLETAEIQTVAPIGYHGRYANSGHIVFARGDSLWATPIDFETLMPVGNTIPVIFDLELYESYGNAGFAISQTGRLIYVSGALDGENGRTLIPALVDRNGDEEHLQIEPGLYGSPQVSPDGKMLSFSIRNESDLDVWVYDFSSGTIGRRTFDGDSSRAIWSSNGQRLIYRCGASDVCSTAANGTDSASILYEGLESNFPNFQTSDGLLAISFGSVPNVHLSSSSVSGQPENILENLEL